MHEAVFTRQSLVGKLDPSLIKLQHTVICNMADLLQWYSRGTVKQKRREETESGREIERFGRNPVCPLTPSFSFACF